MSNIKKAELIDWQELLSEFESFDPGTEFVQIEPDLFARSLVDPLPEFVDIFLQRRLKQAAPPGRFERIFIVPALFKQNTQKGNFAFRKRLGLKVGIGFQCTDPINQFPGCRFLFNTVNLPQIVKSRYGIFH